VARQTQRHDGDWQYPSPDQERSKGETIMPTPQTPAITQALATAPRRFQAALGALADGNYAVAACQLQSLCQLDTSLARHGVSASELPETTDLLLEVAGPLATLARHWQVTVGRPV
jgi:hypothetical protein